MLKDKALLKSVWVGGYMAMAFLLFYPLLRPLNFHSISHPYYSYMPFIPLISLWLIFLNRSEIFKAEPAKKRFGYPIVFMGICVLVLGYFKLLPFSNTGWAIFLSSGAILFWSGLFIWTFGFGSFFRAAFPVILLGFIIPLPDAYMEAIIHNLQRGSAEALSIMLKPTGVPFLRDGTAFHFSNVSINIADRCSGIRSSLALIVATVIISGLTLQHWWKRAVLIASIYPIMLFKNGLRILVVTLLGEYWDLTFITDGFIHSSGGFIFFGIAFFLILLIAHFLRKIKPGLPVVAGKA